MTARSVTVFGGSGFIGRHLVKRLAGRDWRIRIAVRRPSRAIFLKTLGEVGQITPIRAPLQEPAAIEAAVAGVQAVVNLVGILYQKGRQEFAAVHSRGAGAVARAAAAAGVESLVQVSAIGADTGADANYTRTKGAGEAALHSAFPGAVILRPSIVFGPEDAFFNRFAALARLLPALPLIGGGRTRFQPIYVGDVADAIVTCLVTPACRGKTYELGGPREYSFKELMEVLLREIGRKRLLVPVPFRIALLEAALLELLPVPPLTRDQVRLLRHDNVVSEGALTLADLGIEPTALEVIIPTYLGRFRPGGRPRDAATG